ncbi:MAG: hypothetical protein JO322_15255 [Candidatus Eremiobacteraeota bacterium]|nr:hypothetical protein [Candidatus Eremiobacteraeota bacterium]
MNGSKQLLYLSAVTEALTGLVALVSPSLLAWLLFGLPLTIGGELLGRLAGCALIALAIGCWPPEDVREERAPLRGLFAYNVLAAVLLLVIAVRTPFGGVLLWPAVLFHGTLSVLFFLAWRKKRSASVLSRF